MASRPATAHSHGPVVVETGRHHDDRVHGNPIRMSQNSGNNVKDITRRMNRNVKAALPARAHVLRLTALSRSSHTCPSRGWAWCRGHGGPARAGSPA